MDDKNVRQDDDYGGEDSDMSLSEEGRKRSMLSQEKKIEEDLKEVEEEKYEEEETVEWDGSEAERVEDTDAEEYEENTPGIGFSYKLESKEIYKCLKHSKPYRKNASLKAKHMAVQGILILILVIAAIIMKNTAFMYIALIPLVSMIGIWLFPEISIRRLAKDMFSDKEISIEIFPDVIDIDACGHKSKILLDGKCEYEEFEDMIILSPSKGNSLIIPVRSIEPEFLPDVQAMIVSGTLPRNAD